MTLLDSRRGKAAVALLVLVLAVAPAIGAVAQNSDLNRSSGPVETTQLYEDHVTIAQHNRSAMDSPLEYYDDSGQVTTLRAEMNESINNSLRVRADKIDADVLGVFPRKDGDERRREPDREVDVDGVRGEQPGRLGVGGRRGVVDDAELRDGTGDNPLDVLADAAGLGEQAVGLAHGRSPPSGGEPPSAMATSRRCQAVRAGSTGGVPDRSG